MRAAGLVRRGRGSDRCGRRLGNPRGAHPTPVSLAGLDAASRQQLGLAHPALFLRVLREQVLEHPERLVREILASVPEGGVRDRTPPSLPAARGVTAD